MFVIILTIHPLLFYSVETIISKYSFVVYVPIYASIPSESLYLLCMIDNISTYTGIIYFMRHTILSN